MKLRDALVRARVTRTGRTGWHPVPAHPGPLYAPRLQEPDDVPPRGAEHYEADGHLARSRGRAFDRLLPQTKFGRRSGGILAGGRRGGSSRLGSPRAHRCCPTLPWTRPSSACAPRARRTSGQHRGKSYAQIFKGVSGHPPDPSTRRAPATSLYSPAGPRAPSGPRTGRLSGTIVLVAEPSQPVVVRTRCREGVVRGLSHDAHRQGEPGFLPYFCTPAHPRRRRLRRAGLRRRGR